PVTALPVAIDVLPVDVDVAVHVAGHIAVDVAVHVAGHVAVHVAIDVPRHVAVDVARDVTVRVHVAASTGMAHCVTTAATCAMDAANTATGSGGPHGHDHARDCEAADEQRCKQGAHGRAPFSGFASGGRVCAASSRGVIGTHPEMPGVDA